MIPSENPQETTSGPREEILFAPSEIQRLEKRKWILDYAPKNAVGAEIGVFRGHFSAVLCKVLKPKRLYLVDAWTKLGETFGWGGNTSYTGFGKLTTAYAKEDAISRVAGFDKVDVRIVEDFAKPFLTELSEKLDWVYLDTSHLYALTMEELILIDGVLKPHGLILGDDWQPMRHHKDHGVFRAVHDFMRTHPYEVVAAGPAGQWCLRRRPDFHLKIIKNKTSGALHLGLDEFRHPLAAGEPFDIGGVVVLDSADAGERVLRLINGRDGQEACAVTWGLPSNGMSVKFPEAANSQTSRFSIRDVMVHPEDCLELHIEDKAGNRELLWQILVEPRPDHMGSL